MKTKQQDLNIIILNYNGLKWLELTLDSLKKFYLDQTKLDVKVTVVDNASTDGSREFLEQLEWAEVIFSPENLGFAGGNNLALADADSRYVMLLNSDTQFDQRSNLDHLIEYMDQHSDVDVLTPQLLLTDGTIDMASHRGEPDLWASFTYFSKLEKVFPKVIFFNKYHLLDRDFSQIHPIDACSGAAMLVRTSAMKKVGLLDERFFMYAEDLDWCKRFRDQGGKIIYYPSVTITHHKYKSGQKNKDKKIASKTQGFFYDTMWQYFEKHYASKHPRFLNRLVKLIINIKKGVS